MESWRIFVIAAMCLVFVALLAFLFWFVVLRRRLRGSPQLLYFFSFQKELLCLDLNKTPGDIRDGPSLFTAMAQQFGPRVVQDVASVGLCRINSADVLVEVDLRSALSQEHRDSFVQSTALSPAVLTRHGNCTSAFKTGTDDDLVAVVPSITGPRYQAGGTSLPSPVIFPQPATSITTDALLYIFAAEYFYEDTREKLSVHFMEKIEFAFQSGAHGRDIPIKDDVIAFIDQYSCEVRVSNGFSNPSRTARRVAAHTVQYCYGEGQNPTWYPFLQPFRLPIGKWCVRAQSFNISHTESKSASKVFTVESAHQFF